MPIVRPENVIGLDKIPVHSPKVVGIGVMVTVETINTYVARGTPMVARMNIKMKLSTASNMQCYKCKEILTFAGSCFICKWKECFNASNPTKPHKNSKPTAFNECR